jgi:hypothetical protein
LVLNCAYDKLHSICIIFTPLAQVLKQNTMTT